jgi:putative ABC transport system permease protein
MMVAVRTSGDPIALVGAVRDQLHSLLLNQPVAEIRTMNQLLARSLSQQRFSMFLLTIFAGLALVLSAVGIYGVMAYAVAQRIHEIGIRVALGASRTNVLTLVLGAGTKLAVAGVAIGLLCACGLTRLMGTLLYEVNPIDLVTFAGVAVLLTAVALLACYIPARRAMRVDPMIALRYE